MPTPLQLTGLAIATALTLSACGGRVASPEGQECGELVRLGNEELEAAKVKGFGGSVQWIKAANLLAGASFQQQLERFESCIDKARRARIYIQESQK
ncbi:MAG: hypothetical protein MZV65_33775 [Chromatiales bacterium]|nr:hypothetical protein [Chromatiales bacterium]